MAEKNGITRLERAQAAAWKAIREGQKAARESREEMREFRKEMRESREESKKDLREFREEMQKYREESQKDLQKYREESQKDLQKYREESQKDLQKYREESQRAAQESREEMREFRESMRESLQKVGDNIDKLSEENREFRKSLDAANDRSDKFANKFGKFWELMVVPNIKEKFNELGFHFESVAQNFEFDKPNTKGRTLAEVDILLENGDSAIVVEIKDNFKEKYLTEHLVRMKKLKTLPRFANKKLYGAIAAGFVKEEFKHQAFKHGFYVLNRPDSMNVRIEPFPKGCKPKAW